MRPLVSPPTFTLENTFLGRSNWGAHDAALNGNIYFFSALNGALTPQQVDAKSSQLLAILGRPPIASLGSNVRFVRIKAPSQGDAMLQISQLQVRERVSSSPQRMRRCFLSHFSYVTCCST